MVTAALLQPETNPETSPEGCRALLDDYPTKTSTPGTTPHYLDTINAYLQRNTTFGAKELMPNLEMLDCNLLKTLATVKGELEKWANSNALRIRIHPPRIVSQENLP